MENTITKDSRISIDDNEVRNLKNICDEVFGEDNFITKFIWKRRSSSALTENCVSVDHEYVLGYKKSNILFKGRAKDFKNFTNPDNDPKGSYVLGDLTVGMTASMRPNQAYDLINPQTGIVYPYNPNRVWSYIPESMNKLIEENGIFFPDSPNKRPMKKRYMSELKSDYNPISSIIIDYVGLNTEATRIIQETLGGNIFDYSKPQSLLTLLADQVTKDDDLILDFFSGSATTAHAVMQLNAEDGGNRKFIMVQLPEVCDPNSEAAKAGYATICEIGKERIRRAGDKIRVAQENSKENLQGELVDLFNIERDETIIKPKNDNIKEVIEIGQERLSKLKKPLDTGFRVFKLDTTNMKDVYYAAGEFSQRDLLDTISNIKDDRSDIDLLYGCLLDWGVQLTMPHTTEQIENFTVHTVDSPLTDEIDLIACFDTNVSETVVRTIAKRKPTRALFRDSSFADSANKINVFEIFKSISSDTTVKVI